MTPFWKYVGAGNDFAVFDNRNQSLKLSPSLIAKLCHRCFGIGGDGILLLENSSCADFRMRIFNADGSEAEMCGNGLRCLARFLQDRSFASARVKVEVFERIYEVEISSKGIAIDMGAPLAVKWNIPIEVADQSFTVHFLNTGVPHAVIFVEDCQKFPLEKLGPLLRRHPHFGPQGANVDIATLNDKHHVVLRTFERGVEGETLACGTGAVATALAAHHLYSLPSPIPIAVRSGEILQVECEGDGKTIQSTRLIGSAKLVFSGAIDLTDYQT